MNLKDYIDSGRVATYVFGLASEDEQREFKAMCKLHPELIEEKRSFETVLENRLKSEAISPSAGIKEKILASLQTSDDVTPHLAGKIN